MLSTLCTFHKIYGWITLEKLQNKYKKSQHGCVRWALCEHPRENVNSRIAIWTGPDSKFSIVFFSIWTSPDCKNSNVFFSIWTSPDCKNSIVFFFNLDQSRLKKFNCIFFNLDQFRFQKFNCIFFQSGLVQN